MTSSFLVIWIVATIAVLTTEPGSARCSLAVCSRSPNDDTTSTKIICTDGIWPKISDPEPFIPQDSTNLELLNVTVNQDDFQPLQFRVNLTILSLNSITLDGSDRQDLFPLTQFTVQLNRSSLNGLLLNNVPVRELEANYLDGYTGLQRLTFSGCGISRIDPKAFYPLSTRSESNNPLPNFESRLQELRIDICQLKFFPWESLLPLSESLTTLAISNSDLSVIGFSTSDTTQFKFSRLTDLKLVNNSLETIPPSVLNTYPNNDSVRFQKLSFQQNKNKCASCGYMPLVWWARNGTSPTGRLLEVTCTNASGSTEAINGLTRDWQQYPDCEDSSPTTTPTAGTTHSFSSSLSAALLFTLVPMVLLLSTH